MHQGREIPRPHLLEGAPPLPVAPHRREGPGAGPPRADFLGRGARRDRGALQGDRRGGSAADTAVQLRRDHGHASVHVHGPPLLQPPGSELSRPHAVLVRRQGRHEAHARRLGGNGPRALRRGEADPHLGLESGRVQPAPLVPLPAGEAARREADRDRSVAQPDRGKVPPARTGAAGDGRRPRARHDERHHPARIATTASTSHGIRSASRRCASA